MRRLRIMEHISLDGVIEIGKSDSGFPYGEWTAPYRRPEGFATVAALQGEGFDLLLGRRTYDLWSGYWPTAPQSPVADSFNAATKYIATHRPESLAWGPAQAVGPDLVEGVRKLKAKGDKDLLLWGSSTLTSALLEHGLADEIILLVYPVLLGTGKRILAEGAPARSFELTASQAMPSGVVIQSYRAAGALKQQ